MYSYPYRVSIETGRAVSLERLKVIRVHENYDFLLRSLTRREYQELRQQYPDETDFQDAVLRLGTVELPRTFRGSTFDWNAFYAGACLQVYQKILLLSGFVDGSGGMDPDLIQPARDYLASEEARYDLLIMTAFKQYRLEDLLDMDPRVWHILVGLAESELRVMGLDPEVITSPGNVQRQQALAQSEAQAQEELQKLMARRDGRPVQTATDQMVFTVNK